MKTGGHERNKKTDVCKGGKDEKGNLWRGREPMKPHLIREPMQTGPLFTSSFLCLVARTLTLCPDLSASRSPPGGVCVCVCNLWSQKVPVGMFPLSFKAGGHRRHIELCPTKLSMVTSGYAA